MRIPPRRIRSAMKAGGVVYGAAVQLASPGIAEIIGAAGIDSLVRVPTQEPTFLGLVLDAGATGVIVPQTSAVDQGEAVVAATCLAPVGTRGRSANPLVATPPTEAR